MGIEKRLEAASNFYGYPEDGPSVQPIARDALSALLSMKSKLTATEAANAALTAQVAERDKRIAVLEEALEPLAAVGRSGPCQVGTSRIRETRAQEAILWSYGQDDARVLLTVEDARRATRTTEPSP